MMPKARFLSTMICGLKESTRYVLASRKDSWVDFIYETGLQRVVWDFLV